MDGVDYYFALIDAWRNDSTSHDNHRGNALIIVAWIERLLEFAIQTRVTSEFDEPPWRDRLFGGDERGAIDGFAGKIVVGYALALYSEQMREDLQQIRHLRNVFAHSMTTLDFDTPEIADACQFYIVRRIWSRTSKSREWLEGISPRHRFVTAVFIILLHLWGVLSHEDKQKSRPHRWRLHKLPVGRVPSPRKPKQRGPHAQPP